MKPEHKPFGDPCLLCHFPASNHIIFHSPVPSAQCECSLCGLPKENHRAKPKKTKPKIEKIEPLFVGIDGEGQGRLRHSYVFLGMSSADGQAVAELRDPTWEAAWNGLTGEGCAYDQEQVKGLSTEACLDFLLAQPDHWKFFSFSFNYDLTKMLTDLPDSKLWRLFRPETRLKLVDSFNFEPRPVVWNGYKLNLQGAKFTVSKDGKKITVWDVFKFFGTKFVTALKTWKVGNAELWERMGRMKEKRNEFDKQAPHEVIPYCLEECRCMAEIAHKLTDAHTRVGLKLKAYHGAGSSAAAMLKVMGIKEQIKPLPEEMQDAIGRAFFGGRFENSMIGPIREKLWLYDISSAYPYQTCFLPCLVHGTWRRTEERRDLDSCSHALIKYGFNTSRIPDSHKLSQVSLRKRGQKRPAWGPFPYRFDKKSIESGSICFPWTSPGGWVYQEEYLAGEKLFPHVVFKEAWVYEKHCECRPFLDVPEKNIAFYYLYRTLVGKDEGPGLTVKLGVNSVYGKLAQSVGNAVFNCWLWAGMITSGTRGQILELMGQASDLSSILMIATDGIASRERLSRPKPKDTGTEFFLGEDLKPSRKPNPKPLGGWEEKHAPKGMFLARPGIYFPLFPTKEEIADIKGRGVGKGVILDNHDKILGTWLKNLGEKTITVCNVPRFCGAKTSIHRSGKQGAYKFTRADGTQKKLKIETQPPSYGQWIGRAVELGFNPKPKRKRIEMRYRFDWGQLVVRRIGGTKLSAPYDKTVVSAEAKELKSATQIVLEQPDIDFSEFTEEI